MKVLLGIFIICISSLLVAGPSYHGLEGLNFIPSARLPHFNADLEEKAVGQIGFTSRASTQDNLALFPYSFRGSFVIFNNIEVGFTNSSFYYSRELPEFGMGPQTITTGGYIGPDDYIFLFAPSIKLVFEDSAMPQGSLALGYELPFGFFMCFDYIMNISDLMKLHFIIGGGTTFSDLSGFAGLKAELPLNVEFITEVGYRGETTKLTRPQELFISFGLSQRIVDDVTCNFVWRQDQDGTGRLMIGLYTVL